jgi:hypothetical protein
MRHREPPEIRIETPTLSPNVDGAAMSGLTRLLGPPRISATRTSSRSKPKVRDQPKARDHMRASNRLGGIDAGAGADADLREPRTARSRTPSRTS